MKLKSPPEHTHSDDQPGAQPVVDNPGAFSQETPPAEDTGQRLGATSASPSPSGERSEVRLRPQPRREGP